MVEENRKPTVEEMLEAYRQYSERIDETFRKTGGVKVDFTKLPPSYRHIVRMSRVRALSLSAVALLLLFLLSTPYASAMNYKTDVTSQVAMVEAMLEKM